MTLAASPFAVAQEINGAPRTGSQCNGPKQFRRHHMVFRMLSGGAEPLCVWECAHCLYQQHRWHELELTEAEVRRMEECSLDGHKGQCGSARPEMRPRRQAQAGPRARRR